MSSIDINGPLVKSLDKMKSTRFTILAIIGTIVAISVLITAVTGLIELFKPPQPTTVNSYINEK